MWLEIKVLITGIGVLFVVVILAQTILYGLFFWSLLLFIAMALIIFSDIVFGHVYTHARAKYWVDKPPPGKRLIILATLENLIDLDWWDKGPYGKREGVINKQEASIIDRGNFPIHIPNGARGFIAHEKSEKNIDFEELEYAEELYNEFKTNNVKVMYVIAKKQDEQEGETIDGKE